MEEFTKQKKENLNKPVFIKCQELNNILNYPEPEIFQIEEKIYNYEVLDILSSLNSSIAGYNDIPDAFYPSCITHITKIKKYLKKVVILLIIKKKFIKKVVIILIILKKMILLLYKVFLILLDDYYVIID